MNGWAAWAITGGLAVAVPQARQLVRWWHSSDDPGSLSSREIMLRRGKALESGMNVPMLAGLICLLIGVPVVPVALPVGIVVCLLWALQIYVRRTGEPEWLTPPSMRSMSGRRLTRTG